jgi:hypothetical protein
VKKIGRDHNFIERFLSNGNPCAASEKSWRTARGQLKDIVILISQNKMLLLRDGFDKLRCMKNLPDGQRTRAKHLDMSEFEV